MPAIARLTDRQILEIYYHKRDKVTGDIEAPEPKAETSSAPPTLDRAIFELRQLAAKLHISAERLAEAEAKVREKYADEPR
jgi:hypothetical protein